MVQMKSIIQALQASGLKVPVIVGGAPLTQDYADQVGAKGYAPDAASAVDVVNKLI
jgi:5-methyltetrahydrofolate--homocysteine methyltransferase